ncbi:MAG: MaoC/PaaZ C-terminal domain-containing protein [Actinoplanes sp.]
MLSLLPGRRGHSLPDTTLVEQEIGVRREHLAAYNRICGFRLSDTLPATYPHVLAFGSSLRLMTAPGFPFPAVGLVHVANRITQLRPITADEPLSLSVHAADLRDHPRGRQFDVIATASVAGSEVWRGVSTYLSKTSSSSPSRSSSPLPAASAVWRVPAGVGPSYAAVSGDRNPIHTSRLGARLFGFPRPIAHGMWSMARCLAALEGRLPAAYTVDVAFKAPILLPAKVSFAAARTAAGWEFGLSGRRPHLAGEVTRP